MKRICFYLLFVSLLAFGLMGCGEDTGGVKLAATKGVVTFKGSPLKGARLMASPDKGPLAIGISDDSGKFSLWTGTRAGVAIGKIRMSVTVAPPESETSSPSSDSPDAAEPNASVQGMMQAMKGYDEVQKKKGKGKGTATPFDKYADPATSGLFYEIKPGGNELTVELK